MTEPTLAPPPISYPPELPISQRRDDILAAIQGNQVVVIAGETGSGKTTQLPKMCLELGRGRDGAMIGHTQPRRLAARAVAERIAEELGTDLGDRVGYAVRFTDRVGPSTQVKLMTDGILLAEMSRDRRLSAYDTIIIDEAHERSLNIDFLLGYLKRLLPRRPDLKLVITSATIDPQRFAEHFGGAPVIEVSGRSYPVEVRYRPLAETDGVDQPEAICAAVDELCAEGPGDILVFLSGEREIRDAADALSGSAAHRGTGRSPGRQLEVLPLYSRLSAAEQHRIFAPHTGRRVVLATNVAETSLTVPGIHYVVDPGTARISRFSQRTKVQRLPIEPISQASARQRSGRCGRLAAGVAIRLYSEADFESRPAFTEPEILRTSLASVILRMADLGLGDVAAFPFLDPPDQRNIRDGVAELVELGALEADRGAARQPLRLTPIGRRMARLPIDPRLARMIVEADRLGVLPEVLVIAAGLSIQDPRERPVEATAAADAAHGRFADETSDFLALLNLWDYLREQQRELSSSAFRRRCRAEFLHHQRIREWQDLHAQLRQLARGGSGHGRSGPVRPAEQRNTEAIHQALLAGLLSHLGMRELEGREFLGARGAKFAIFPGSALFKKPPAFIMAAELVETSRLWARVCARIEPEWAEALAGHLVKRNYSEPHWSKKRAAVLAYEKVTLYGVPLAANRRVGYAQVDPELARELFIRHALVEGDWHTRHPFFEHNQRLLHEAEELEHRARRRDLVVDDQALFEFYDQRLPAEVVSGRHFDSWWKKTRRQQPELLTFDPAMLLADSAEQVRTGDYPDAWVLPAPGYPAGPAGSAGAPLELPLRYQFEPGTAADGVTVRIPLAVLNQVSPEPFEWQVPGLRVELATAMIRALPKELRRHVVPAPDRAREAVTRLPSQPSGPFGPALAAALEEVTGVRVPPGAWDADRVPPHLRVTFQVVDADGAPLAEGKDLAGLQAELAPRLRQEVAAAASGLERTGLRDWPADLPELPRTVEFQRGGHLGRGYPALVAAPDPTDRKPAEPKAADPKPRAAGARGGAGAVAVRVLGTEAEQRAAMRAGTRALLALRTPPQSAIVLAGIDHRTKLALSRAPHAGAAALFEDCTAASLDAIIDEAGGVAWDAAGFTALAQAARVRLRPVLTEVVHRVAEALTVWHEAQSLISRSDSLRLLPSLTDAREQLAGLVYPGFVAATGAARLPDLVRYLRAAVLRLERLPERPERDQALLARVAEVREEHASFLAGLPPARRSDPDVVAIRWMIEEFRVSLFAQQVKTAYPVSEKRIYQAMDAAESAT